VFYTFRTLSLLASSHLVSGFKIIQKKKFLPFLPQKKNHQRALSFDTPHIFKAHRE
jgi:hypothetical protein